MPVLAVRDLGEYEAERARNETAVDVRFRASGNGECLAGSVHEARTVGHGKHIQHAVHEHQDRCRAWGVEISKTNKPGLAIAKDGRIVALEHVFGDRQRDAFKHLGLLGRRVENTARKREGVAVLAIVNVARIRVLCARNGSRIEAGRGRNLAVRKTKSMRKTKLIDNKPWERKTRFACRGG